MNCPRSQTLPIIQEKRPPVLKALEAVYVARLEWQAWSHGRDLKTLREHVQPFCLFSLGLLKKQTFRTTAELTPLRPAQGSSPGTRTPQGSDTKHSVARSRLKLTSISTWSARCVIYLRFHLRQQKATVLASSLLSANCGCKLR